jgi:hypothetical protein
MGDRRADYKFSDQIAQPGAAPPAPGMANLLGPGMSPPPPPSSLGEILAALMRKDFQRRMAQRKETKP